MNMLKTFKLGTVIQAILVSMTNILDGDSACGGQVS